MRGRRNRAGCASGSGRAGHAARPVQHRRARPGGQRVAEAERPAPVRARPRQPRPAGQPRPRLRRAVPAARAARGRPGAVEGAVDGPQRAGRARRRTAPPCSRPTCCTSGHRPTSRSTPRPGRRRCGPGWRCHPASSATTRSPTPSPRTGSCWPTSRTPSGRSAFASGTRRCARRRGWPWPGTGRWARAGPARRRAGGLAVLPGPRPRQRGGRGRPDPRLSRAGPSRAGGAGVRALPGRARAARAADLPVARAALRARPRPPARARSRADGAGDRAVGPPSLRPVRRRWPGSCLLRPRPPGLGSAAPRPRADLVGHCRLPRRRCRGRSAAPSACCSPRWPPRPGWPARLAWRRCASSSAVRWRR